MYKSKDGKVYASLTEVKNKTGDIFALVDEFNEVSISSYNKVRYKIVKVDINSVIDLSETEKAKSNTPRKSQIKKEVIVPTREMKEDKKIEAPIENEIINTDEIIEINNVEANSQEEVLEVPEVKIEVYEEPQVKQDQSSSITGMIVPWNRDSHSEREFVTKAIKNLN